MIVYTPIPLMRGFCLEGLTPPTTGSHPWIYGESDLIKP
jgi:hypothetical protein